MISLLQSAQSKKDNQNQSQPKSRPDKAPDNIHISPIAGLVGGLIYVIAIIGAIVLDGNKAGGFATTAWAISFMLAGTILLFAIKVAQQWEKAVVLRLGKFHGLRGPGLFWIVPIVDSTPVWIDQRVMVTPFNAEKSLTKDTVPVNVDAVLFWVIWDAEKAALEVQDYRQSISWASQTALREVIGQMTLADILIGRGKMDADLQKIIDERTTPWGISVQSVEIRDVIIPQGLEDAMSQQAQAERERQSRVILGEAEMQVAGSFAEASKVYINNPTALHLRAMNMLFEGLKQKGALVIVPSSAVDTMNLGGLTGMVALAKKQTDENQ